MRNNPPMTIRAADLPRIRAITANVAPKEIDPALPSQIRAGYTLKYKKANKLPSQRAIKIDIGVSKADSETTQNAVKHMNSNPEASPSRPSEKSTAVEKMKIIIVDTKGYSHPNWRGPKNGT